MLYAAHLAWTSASRVLVAGGTVFGNVIVWEYRLAADGVSHAVLFVLRGHEGSIYGVDMSPELALPDGSAARLLASCSDDRTIRVWDITERSAPHPSTLGGGDTVETGFKAAESYDDVQSAVDHDDGRATAPVAVAMGHASRIWGVKFAVEPQADMTQPLSLYSFGEDATTQRWRLGCVVDSSSGPCTLSGTLIHQHTYSLHNGKHLWARALSLHGGKVTIATGGGDGTINLIHDGWRIGKLSPPSSKLEDETPGTRLVTVDVPDLLRPETPSTSREMISRYDFVLDDEMLAITNTGALFVGSLSEYTPAWAPVVVEDAALADDLKLCYVLRRVGNAAAVLGTTNGKVFFFRCPGYVHLVAQVPGRIVEINCLSDPSSSSVQLLVHLHGSSSSRYLTLDSTTGSLQGQAEVAGLDGRFVPVSAAKLDDLLIIGSRHGWMSLLTLQTDNLWRPLLDASTRSRDAITAIIPLPAQNATTPSSCILTTSRDGKYRIYEIQRKDNSAALILLHETSPPFGPMIEGAWFTGGPNPELILYGFKSKHFVIWNESQRQELATVDCGGAHRTFRLVYSTWKPGRYRFAYTRTSRLSIFSQDTIPHMTLKPGTHGREVRALSSNKRYVASGAEDTSIRIWEYAALDKATGVQAQMRYLACMKAHVTGIQKLHWFEDDYLFSSAGNEEFFVWRVRTLPSAYPGPAVVCEGVFSDKSPVGDLRIMDFDISRLAGANVIIITLAFSNSTLKTYEYANDGSFKLLSSGSYTGACLTQLRHIDHRHNDLWTVTASTDGHLALWNTSLDCSSPRSQAHALIAAAPVHQCSIKSLDMVCDETAYWILTGGDDNGIGFTVLAKSPDEVGGSNYLFATRGIVRKAHAAAVNGVALLRSNDDDEGDDMLGVSTSNDQRVKVWRISKKMPQRVRLACAMSSGVADPGDVSILCQGRTRQVILGGVGVEVWRVVQ